VSTGHWKEQLAAAAVAPDPSTTWRRRIVTRRRSESATRKMAGSCPLPLLPLLRERLDGPDTVRTLATRHGIPIGPCMPGDQGGATGSRDSPIHALTYVVSNPCLHLESVVRVESVTSAGAEKERRPAIEFPVVSGRYPLVSDVVRDRYQSQYPSPRRRADGMQRGDGFGRAGDDDPISSPRFDQSLTFRRAGPRYPIAQVIVTVADPRYSAGVSGPVAPGSAPPIELPDPTATPGWGAASIIG
jgi:hypothetical protein